MNNFFKILQEKNHILADGATGTNLFAMGLETGDPPEPWNINHKDRIRSLHQGFVDAGSDLFLTNSFGGTSFRLKLHNLEKRVFELNKSAGDIAREVADHADRLVIVAGSMVSTGEMIEPHGLMTPNEATDAFRAQAEGLAEGGVDVLWLETMYAMEELEAAMDAVKDLGLPVCATMSFDTAGKTMMGITPKNLARKSQDLELAGFGANCGIGAADLIATINGITQNVDSETVVIAKANCGIPEFHDGNIHYSGTENLMPFAIEAARQRATVGEMSDAMASEFGRHRATIQGVRGIWKQHMQASADMDLLKDRVEEFSKALGRAPRILVAKLGQDGHDRGQKVIASAFADLGFDVVTGPLFQTPDEVYDLAISHDVDAVGISTLAAAHLSQVPQLRKKLDAGAGRHIELVVGGVIPPGDIPLLERDGAAAVFLPGTKSTDAAMRLLDLLARRRNIS